MNEGKKVCSGEAMEGGMAIGREGRRRELAFVNEYLKTKLISAFVLTVYCH